MRRRLTRLLRKELPAYCGFGRKPQARFLIFAQGRTGTWLLHSMLNAHPQITCAKEILQRRVLFPVHFVEGYADGRGQQVFGCHVQINQLLTAQATDPARFLNTLHANGWSIIYLWRRNIVRQSISTMIAMQRREWHTDKPDALQGQTFRIDGDQLQQWLDRRERHLALERALLADMPHLELVYEDDLQHAVDHQATMDRLFTFLQLPPIQVAAGVARLSPKQLPDYVANYAELTGLLQGTRFEEHLLA